MKWMYDISHFDADYMAKPNSLLPVSTSIPRRSQAKSSFTKWLLAWLFSFTAMTAAAQAHSSKYYSIGGTARVVFKMNDAHIRPDVSQNKQELDKITAMLSQVLSDPTAEVQRIVICGYGSPDGPYVFNERLAKQRTNNLKAYTARYAGIPQNVIEVRYVAEDWEGLKAFVQSASLHQLPHRKELLQVIRSNRTPDEKERIIRKRYPKDFNYLKRNCLAQLRRTEYRIEYRTKDQEAALKWEKNTASALPAASNTGGWSSKSSGRQQTGNSAAGLQGSSPAQSQTGHQAQQQSSHQAQQQSGFQTQQTTDSLTQQQINNLAQQLQNDSLTQLQNGAFLEQLKDSIEQQIKDSMAQQLENAIVQQLKDSLVQQLKDSLASQKDNSLLHAKKEDSHSGGMILWILLILLLLIATALILRYAAILRQRNKTISMLQTKLEQSRQAMMRKQQERAASMMQNSQKVTNGPKSNIPPVAAPVIIAAKEEEAPENHPAEAPIEKPSEAPVEEPTEEPAAAPVEEPAAAPVEEPAAAPIPPESSQDYERFKKMDEAVTDGKLFLNADMNREQLMRIAGVDKNKLAMLLRQYAGTNFSGYINSKRMEYAAKQLTEHPDQTMKDIAAACGFSSLSTFFRVFKSVYGSTPTEYIQTGKLPQTPHENAE